MSILAKFSRLDARLVAVLTLLAEILIFYRHVLFYPGYLIPYDLQVYHYPQIWFVARSFQRGELPLWDPYSYCGFPIYANLTTQLFYPPTAIVAFLSNLVGYEHLYYLIELQLIAHILFSGLCTYWLLRKLGITSTAALLGATIFQLGAFFTSQTQHLGAINAAAWMPLAWICVLSLAERFAWRWVGLLALTLAMSVLSGFPQVTVAVFASCTLLAVLLALRRDASWKVLVALAAAIVWSILLAAVQLLPTAELSSLSLASRRGQWLLGTGGVPVPALASMVAPNYFSIFEFKPGAWTLPWNPTFLYLYCGIAALLFIGVAMVWKPSRHVPVFASLTVISALAMLGGSTPVGAWLFPKIPASVRAALYMEFWMSFFTLSVAVLAALGADRFLQSRSVILKAGVVLLTAADLIAAGSGRFMNTTYAPDEKAVTYDYMDGYTILPRTLRDLVNSTTPPARIDTRQGSPLWSGSAPLLEVPSANGNDPFAIFRLLQARFSFGDGEPWTRWMEVANPASPIVSLLNIKYVITNAPDSVTALEKAGFRKAAELPGNQVFENPNVLPRFFLVNQVRKATDLNEAVAILRSPGFDPRSSAVVEGPIEDMGSKRSETLPSVKVLEYSPLRVSLKTTAPTPAFLVSSEVHYPGWRAFVDGREQPLVMTNVAFRGLPLPAGEHSIEMRFEPAILWRSALISLTALGALMVALIGGRTEVRPGTLKRAPHAER